MTAMSTVTKSARVPLRHKVTFPLAEFGSQFVWNTVGSYLLLYIHWIVLGFVGG